MCIVHLVGMMSWHCIYARMTLWRLLERDRAILIDVDQLEEQVGELEVFLVPEFTSDNFIKTTMDEIKMLLSS